MKRGLRLAAGCTLIGACFLGGCSSPFPPEKQPLCLEIERVGDTSQPVDLFPNGACYQFTAGADAAVRLEIDQLEGDLTATIRGADDNLILSFDTPVDDDAPERPCIVTEAAGRFRLDLKTDAPQGRATVGLTALRTATAEDHACAKAAQGFMVALEQLKEGNSRQVARAFEAAADLWRTAGDPFSEAMARRSGARVWRDLGEHSIAEEQLEMALFSARQAANDYLEVSILNRLGVVRLWRSDLEAAESALDEALTLSRSRTNLPAEATALNNLALVEQARGRTRAAVRRLRQAEAIQRTLEEPSSLALTLHNLAFNLALRDHLQDALTILDEAEQLALASGAELIRVECLLTRGWIHRLQGRPELALKPIQDVLQFWQDLGNVTGQAVALDRLGTVLRETGDFQGAAIAYTQSLEIVPSSARAADLAPTMMGLGCLYEESGDLAKAQHWLDKARTAFQDADDPLSLAHLEYCLSLLAESNGKLAEAIRHSGRAMKIVEDLKVVERLQGARHRPIWLWQDYAEQHTAQRLALSEAQGDPVQLELALSTADYARARSLQEMIWETQLSERQEDKREQALHQQLLELVTRRAASTPRRAETEAETEEQFERQVTALLLELADLQEDQRSWQQRLGDLPVPRPSPVAEMRQLLGPGEVLLRYFLAESESFLFVLDSHSLKVTRLPSRRVLEAYAVALHRALRSSARDPELANLLARSTAKQLLPDGVLAESTSTLVVVPDGALHYVSFAALIPSSGASDETLAERLTLRYLPSAGVGLALLHRAEQRTPAPKMLAMVADPVFSELDERLQAEATSPPMGSSVRGITPERLPSGVLPRLPYTAAEAEGILALLPSSECLSFLGFAAEKETVLTPALRQYRILHFATHAFVDERFPEFSGLVLSRRRADGAEVDGNLYLQDIFSLRLHADLVVLSGCQTALGRKVRGDGLLSLTRGFFSAGASQVLVSLWSVDDRATAALMVEFYRALLTERLPAAEALRAAQQRLRSQPQWQAPYYWAPFVLQGVAPQN